MHKENANTFEGIHTQALEGCALRIKKKIIVNSYNISLILKPSCDCLSLFASFIGIALFGIVLGD